MKNIARSFCLLIFLPTIVLAQLKPRARDLGIPFDGTPGPLNAITDVKGVEVGYTTLIEGGNGPHAVRTGVTVILPRGKNDDDPVFAGWSPLNAVGEMTGTGFVHEEGFLEGPISLTNSLSIGVVRDAISTWMVKDRNWPNVCCLPVVAETYDGHLNDIIGFHVKAKDVVHAISTAASGAVAEGNVGGGTGMILFGFKGGNGTASRKLDSIHGGFTIAAFVQANFGDRRELRIAGVEVGRELIQNDQEALVVQPEHAHKGGSIIIVIATDVPLLPHQLDRVARRAALGLARTGSIMGDTSGDFVLAFSTANSRLVGVSTSSSETIEHAPVGKVDMLPSGQLDPVFEATVEATEEAIINALVAAETMTGKDNHTVKGIDHQRLKEILKKYNKLAPASKPPLG